MKLEPMFITELKPHISQRFHTIEKRDSRIIQVFSIGGCSVARLGFKHPKYFAAASMLGAGPSQ